MSYDAYLGLIYIIVILIFLSVVGFVGFSIYKFVFKKQIRIVNETSKCLQALKELNQDYKFISIPATITEQFVLNSKREFDRFDPGNGMMSRIADNRDTYVNLVQQSYYNSDLYYRYQTALSKLPVFTKEKTTKLRLKRYQKLERELYKRTVKNPVLSVQFCVDWEYTSPQGRNYYHEKRVFQRDEIEQILRYVYQRENFKTSKEYQRAIMTPSLRYDVLRRDHFRCVICGRTAQDGIKLHVDHIRPVSKGGKTEMLNLRTLCNQCNSGKSDKWVEGGLN